MLPRMLLLNLVLICLFPQVSTGQNSVPAAATTQEFPVVLQQSVTAGKTPVGTKVQAKLFLATMVNGKVIPKNALFSGEVTESVAKTGKEPSRISIRMDSAQWKEGSEPLKAYLTAWFYPTLEEHGQDLQYGPTQSAKATWNGQGQYPDQNSKVYRPFPGGDSGQGSSVPDTPTPITSDRRTPMKNVETEHHEDGGTVLLSKHGNIKLDRFTTYVLAQGNAIPMK